MSFLPSTSSESTTEAQVRNERTERILTVAAELLVQWSYKRVTIEDIATHAGVGTGTIYLHWKTKQILFETVLLRELVALWGELIQRLHIDPAEALLHRFMRTLLLTIKQRPVARAVFTRDVTVLGKLAQSSLAQQHQHMNMSNEWIGMLRQLGLLRMDMDIDTQAYAFSAIWTGFSQVDQFLSAGDVVTTERQSDAIVETIRRTLEPDVLPTSDDLRDVVAPTMIQFFDQACTYYLTQIEQHMIPPRNVRANV